MNCYLQLSSHSNSEQNGTRKAECRRISLFLFPDPNSLLFLTLYPDPCTLVFLERGLSTLHPDPYTLL